MALVRCCILIVLATLFGAASADFQVVGPDGRRILLKDDFTWSYVSDRTGTGREKLILSIGGMTQSSGRCSFWVQLENRSSTMIRSLVPQVSAMTRSGTAYETVFAGFSFVKPTRTSSKQIRFKGIDCKSIAYLKVSGADRCNMGDLTPATATSGQCLARIRIQPTETIRVSK